MDVKNLLLTGFIVLSALMLQAQDPTGNYNPFVAEGTIIPAPLPPNGTGVLSFKVGNTGDDALVLVTGKEMQLLITLSRGVPNNADPLAAIGGRYAGMFTWTYDGKSNTYTGVQKQTIPGGEVGYVTIQYKVTANSTPSGPQNCFKVKLTPPSYANTSNARDDDQVSSCTWTGLK